MTNARHWQTITSGRCQTVILYCAERESSNVHCKIYLALRRSPSLASQQPLLLPPTPDTMQLLEQLGAHQAVSVTSSQGYPAVSLQVISGCQPSVLLSEASVPQKVRTPYCRKIKNTEVDFIGQWRLTFASRCKVTANHGRSRSKSGLCLWVPRSLLMSDLCHDWSQWV